jgi:uncharacterized protein (TIGR02271 family)
MLQENELQSVIGSSAHGQDGEKIGTVGQVFLDDQTGVPEFATVNTGFFGTNESFVPITNAEFTGDGLTVPYTKDQVKDAPKVGVNGGHLDQAEERALYDHYGVPYSENASDSGLPTGDASTHDTSGVVGHDTSGPTTDEAMTRSEEHLKVGTAREERGRVRLRKYVTSEQQTVSVPVTKERAVLETEPITEDNVDNAMEGPAISEEEHEVVLSEERAVISKTTEPVERVRLGTETVTDQETVTEEVRKEHIEAEGDIDDRRSNA